MLLSQSSYSLPFEELNHCEVNILLKQLNLLRGCSQRQSELFINTLHLECRVFLLQMNRLLNCHGTGSIRTALPEVIFQVTEEMSILIMFIDPVTGSPDSFGDFKDQTVLDIHSSKSVFRNKSTILRNHQHNPIRLSH